MTDITEYLLPKTPIVDAIYDAWKTEGDKEAPRGYLGASILGHPCSRYLWYNFRFCCREDFPGRLYRLFETGHIEETRHVKDLRMIGCTIYEVDPRTGKQFEISALAGHLSGHMDGCVLGVPSAEKTWHVYEGKTHNRKSFGKLVKDGVEKSKPVHYAQMQLYMHETGMKRALYMATNKDTDELYAERVRHDKSFCEGLLEKAERIVFANSPPRRLSERPDWYECGFCSAHALCHGAGATALPIPEINCRQCCHATPTLDGNAHWTCEKHARGLSIADQRKACCDHLALPGLFSFAEPTDSNYGNEAGGITWVEFTNKDGGKWKHGGGAGGFTTSELRTVPVSVLTNPTVEAAKELFGAEAFNFGRATVGESQ